MSKLDLKSIFSEHKINNDEKWFLKNADLKKRNLLRTILYNEDSNKRKNINKLRSICTIDEIVKIENIISQIEVTRNESGDNIISELFPKNPKIYNIQNQLKPLSIDRTLNLINAYTHQNKKTLELFIENIYEINYHLLKKDFKSCDVYIKKIIEDCGFSLILIRKILLLNELNDYVESDISSFSRDFIKKYNNNGSNIPISSLQQCYQSEVDYLSLKKSLMRFSSNDSFLSFIVRTPYKYRSNESEKSAYLNYSLYSSLVDALIHIKLNEDLYDIELLKGIQWFIELIDSHSFNINDVSRFYLDFFEDSEDVDEFENLLYKQSSAWYEVLDMKSYRFLQDLFYEDPNSPYIDFDDKFVLSNISQFIEKNNLMSFISENDEVVCNENNNYLLQLIKYGFISQSSIFNYKIFLTNGYWYLSKNHLFSIMEKTRDLPRTIDSDKLKNMSNSTDAIESEIAYYMLISKKTRNDLDGFKLRKLIQKITIDRFESNLVKLLEHFYRTSPTVAFFTYEVLTEDFLALMPSIITSAYEITETRASLHDWRGKYATLDEKRAYVERAKILRIDHQINKIRNEIDDNRIYVDMTLFNEWIFNEAYREVNNIIMSLAQHDLLEFESPQLLDIINRIYEEFCTNNIFGITSYLGRRIRHGTFKGHTFYDVNSSLESKFPFLTESYFSKIWEEWKFNYESLIDNIIRNKLHVESEINKQGIIKPTIYNNFSKEEIVTNYINMLIQDYKSNDGVNIISIADEYCWNLITIDLRNMNIFLKDEKNKIMESARINLLEKYEIYLSRTSSEIATPFKAEFQRTIDEKFKMIYEWFKRPQSVAPKVLLSLLFTAVVKEVKDTYKDFKCTEHIAIENDIELLGGSYLGIYDALFVVVFNAAKHGKKESELKSNISFNLSTNEIRFEIKSDIKDDDSEEDVNARLEVSNDDDIDNAQLVENKSGIKKLYNLDRYDNYFTLREIKCYDRKVHVLFTYKVKSSV